MTFYVVEIEKNKLLTHDGKVQLGVFFMSMKKFLKSASIGTKSNNGN